MGITRINLHILSSVVLYHTHSEVIPTSSGAFSAGITFFLHELTFSGRQSSTKVRQTTNKHWVHRHVWILEWTVDSRECAGFAGPSGITYHLKTPLSCSSHFAFGNHICLHVHSLVWLPEENRQLFHKAKQWCRCNWSAAGITNA